jgi:Uma2 family endonuclease
MAETTKLLTAEDLMRMPTDQPWELWDGVSQQIPGAGGLASWIAGTVGVAVRSFVSPRKLGLVTGADGTYTLARNPDTVVIPDCAFVRRDRLPGGVVPKGHAPVPPDLAIEVRSPWTEPSTIDIGRKQEFYRRAGVPLVWWVHPKRRTVAVYRDGELAAELGEGDDLDGGNVLPGFRLPVAEIVAEA